MQESGIGSMDRVAHHWRDVAEAFPILLQPRSSPVELSPNPHQGSHGLSEVSPNIAILNVDDNGPFAPLAVLTEHLQPSVPVGKRANPLIQRSRRRDLA